jgi:hypothetical protein
MTPLAVVGRGVTWHERTGLLDADQDFGHRRFFSQILTSQLLSRSTPLAAVGS